MNSQIKRAAFLFSAVLALDGCARRESAPQTDTQPILRISQRNEPADLDPAIASLPDEFFVIRALSEGLVIPAPDGGNVLPAAAERWDVSPDHLEYTFHLRSNERWSNGEPVISNDFLESFRRVLSPGTAAPNAALFFPVKNARDYLSGKLDDFGSVGLKAPDSRTLAVILGRPMPPGEFLLYAASGPWIPVNPRTVARFGRQWTRPGYFVGNGAYRLTEWLPNQRITVRPNPFYRAAGQVRLAAIQFVRFDDEDSEERAYRAGQIDVTMKIPTDRIDTYARERPAELHRAPLAETRYLSFNTRRPPLNDPRVRQALSLTIDRQRIVNDVLRGGQEPAGQLIPAAISAGMPGDSPRRTPGYNPDEARKLLAAAGYPGGRNFPHLELAGWSSTPVLEAIQAMWKKELGIDAVIVLREARAHVAALRSGAYDIGFITLIPDVPVPISILENFTSDSPNNYPHWSDAIYDGLLQQAEAAGDSADAKLLLRRAESRLLAEAPLAPVYFNSKDWLMGTYVHGWREDALWTRYYGDLWMDNAGARAEPLRR
ncbi:MAG: peptide ABC transporter substrate-binding protein [Opitutaceae bacterium]